MQVEYQFEPRDIEAWIVHARFRSRDHRVAHWVAIVGLGGGGAWMGSKLGWNPLSTLLCGVVGFLFGSSFAVLGMKASAQVTANASGSASLSQFGLHRLDVTAGGVAEVGPAGSHSHSWEAVEGLWETADHLFVGIVGGYGYVVPKRELSPEQASALKAELEAHVAVERRRTKQ